VPIGYEAGWAPVGLGTVEKNLALLGTKPRLFILSLYRLLHIVRGHVPTVKMGLLLNITVVYIIKYM
jgi:hypothetical protein